MKKSWRLEQAVLQLWYKRKYLPYLLLPLSAIFYFISLIRKFWYLHIIKSALLAVPVIVVGNITAGGSGKTPLVIWLAEFLRRQGYQPGIISRGYGGKQLQNPAFVTADSQPHEVGDEPVLLAKRTQCPVVVAVQRTAAAQMLLANTDCDIILCDDGLQHYALPRDLEIAVIDGERGLGNELLLPAGPLREPVARLNEVDFVVVNGQAEAAAGLQRKMPALHPFYMRLVAEQAVNLREFRQRLPLADFRGQTLHAVAGIGNPSRFFQQLTQAGLDIISHPFPDHYPFSTQDFRFAPGNLPIMMTEKDAIKCFAFAESHYWFVPVAAELTAEFETALLNRLQELV